MSAGLRHRPIFGGVFGKAGRYSMATMPCIEKGLHSVRYLVIETHAGAVLAQADDKLEALASARRLLRATAALAERLEPGVLSEQGTLWPNDEVPRLAPGARRRPVSRRRRDVFERTGGLCHYCGCGLTLGGPWHVEHMMPRALGGEDELVNLVAACAPCNLAKRDRTALEFLVGRA